MIRFSEKKATAGEFAKATLMERIDMAVTYWAEHDSTDFDSLTQKEIISIQAALDKHRDRIHTFLGISRLEEKDIY